MIKFFIIVTIRKIYFDYRVAMRLVKLLFFHSIKDEQNKSFTKESLADYLKFCIVINNRIT